MVTHDESLSPRFSRTLRITDGELETVADAGEVNAQDASPTAQQSRLRLPWRRK
jgi:ABC-type lipoprotein export system ATPase subunit